MITADGSAGGMMPVGEIMAAGDGNTGDGEKEDLSIDASVFYAILEEKQLASPVSFDTGFGFERFGFAWEYGNVLDERLS